MALWLILFLPAIHFLELVEFIDYFIELLDGGVLIEVLIAWLVPFANLGEDIVFFVFGVAQLIVLAGGRLGPNKSFNFVVLTIIDELPLRADRDARPLSARVRRCILIIPLLFLTLFSSLHLFIIFKNV